MPRVGEVLVSFCGIVYSYCPAYRKKLCPGCDTLTNECEYIKCAMARGAENCLLCTEFPCRLHREGFKWSRRSTESCCGESTATYF